MKILVTGADGFIGTHLCLELQSAEHEVIGIDRVQGDLLDPYIIDNALDRYHPDIVVHLAAKVGRLFGENDLKVTVTDNAAMTAIVAKACGDRDVQLAYASTSEVYGDLGDSIAVEGGKMKLPHNLYGLSKRWGEEVAQLYAPKGLINFRLSMPYGPGLPAGIGRAAMINFLYNALTREEITVHHGSERSWCYVGDTVRGIRMVLESGLRGDWNIGRDDNPISMLKLAEKCCEMTGAPKGIIMQVEPPSRQTVVKRLSTDKLRAIGWEPEVELEEGMEITLDWIKAGFPALENEKELI